MVNSVQRAVRVLRLLGEEEEGLSLAELTRRMDAPKSTIFSILQTLESERLVARDSRNGSYTLGIRLLEFGRIAADRFDLRVVAKPYLQGLNFEFDETIHLCILEDDQILYVECFESSKRLRINSVLGVRAPLYCNSVGKALLAYRPAEERDRLIGIQPYVRFTAHTITEAEALRAEVDVIRSRGYAIDEMERDDGVRCVGVPILDSHGLAVASISLAGPEQRVTPERVPVIAESLKRAAADISRSLGFRV
jgi:IclR family transcriptional regulator, KDG regulon repressor